MRLAVLAILLLSGFAAPAGAVSCSVELNGGYRCDDGSTLKPDGQGGLKAGSGTLSPDGSGGFRGPNGIVLRPNGYGGLNVESGARATTGGSSSTPLQPRMYQGPDSVSGRRVEGGGFAVPQPGKDCRPDTFGGYRCR